MCGQDGRRFLANCSREDYQEIIRKPAARVGRGMTKSLAYIEPSDEDSDE